MLPQHAAPVADASDSPIRFADRGGLAYFNTWRTKTMKCILRLSAWALLTGMAATGIAAAADEIRDWNQMLLQAMLANPVTPAPLTMRVAAIVQASVFDAVNGIDRRY